MTEELVPGAEPFFLPGGDVGVLMLHGFTGNPVSVRPWGEALARRGLTVCAPRLPGHGTSWRDLENRRADEWIAEAHAGLNRLRARGGPVVVCGLSFGGALGLLVSAMRPEDVRGIVAVNPYVRDRRQLLLPLVRPFLRSVAGIGNDISKPGGDERAYPRVPLRAWGQAGRIMRQAQARLPEITQPFLLFHSPQDHIVPRGTAEWVFDRIGSEDKELVLLPRSFHVATLDHDAETIFERSTSFIERVARR